MVHIFNGFSRDEVPLSLRSRNDDYYVVLPFEENNPKRNPFGKENRAGSRAPLTVRDTRALFRSEKSFFAVDATRANERKAAMKVPTHLFFHCFIVHPSSFSSSFYLCSRSRLCFHLPLPSYVALSFFSLSAHPPYERYAKVQSLNDPRSFGSDIGAMITRSTLFEAMVRRSGRRFDAKISSSRTDRSIDSDRANLPFVDINVLSL